MNKENKYAKAYKNLLKSFLVILVLSIFSTIAVMVMLNSLFSGDIEPLVNNIIAIVVGIFTSLIFQVILIVIRDGKTYINDLDNNNKILRNNLINLFLISEMISFAEISKNNEMGIPIIYKDIQMCKLSLNNNELFDKVAIIGLNSLFDDLISNMAEISNKNELSKKKKKLLSTIEIIVNIIEELILSNENEKIAFIKEEERLENLFNKKKKS